MIGCFCFSSEAVVSEHPLPSSTQVVKAKQHSNYSYVNSPEVIPLTPEVRKSVLNVPKSKSIKVKPCECQLPLL